MAWDSGSVESILPLHIDADPGAEKNILIACVEEHSNDHILTGAIATKEVLAWVLAYCLILCSLIYLLQMTTYTLG